MQRTGIYRDYTITIDGKDIRIVDTKTNREIPIRNYYDKLWIRTVNKQTNKPTNVALLRVLYITFIDSTITSMNRVYPKDGDYTNYQLDNLIVSDSQINVGRKKKLNARQIKRILDDYNNEDYQQNITRISKKHKLSKGTVWQVVNGVY